ncbi:MAG: SGNH/GDSL hydrolase family protein [Polyangiales bacterium]
MNLRKLGCAFAILAAACGSSGDGSADPTDGAADDTTTTLDGAGGTDTLAAADSGVDASTDGAKIDSGTPPTDVGTDTSTAPKSDIHFIGRFDTSDAKGPRFEWSGSAIRTRFSGTGIDVKLGGSTNVFFQVVVDNVPTQIIKTSGAASYSLASGLSDAEHDVMIYRRNEAFAGPVQFLGFTVAGGKPLVPSPAQYTRHIEFIGDSITCGYGIEGTSPTCPFTADTEDEYFSYAGITARNLSAEQITIAWSGIGVYRDYGGSTTDQMPVRYERALPESATSKWDFSKWQADVVVINLGTNDFAKGDPATSYTTALTSFVKQVRGHYAKAEIFLALGPMLSGGNLDKARTYITGVQSSLTAAGDTHLSFVEFDQQKTGEIGCDYHPNLVTHQKMATKLTAAIKSKMAW